MSSGDRGAIRKSAENRIDAHGFISARASAGSAFVRTPAGAFVRRAFIKTNKQTTSAGPIKVKQARQRAALCPAESLGVLSLRGAPLLREPFKDAPR